VANDDFDLTEEVREILHTVTAQGIVIKVLVNALEQIEPGMRDKVVRAARDAARQAGDNGMQDLAAELQAIAGDL
jgi:hypothetical protein